MELFTASTTPLTQETPYRLVTDHYLLESLRRQVASVNPVGIVASQNIGDVDGLAQSSSEAGSGTLRSLAAVVVLREGNILCVGLAGAPLFPAHAGDDIAHLGVLEGHTRILRPGAAEVNGALANIVAISSLDGGLVDHVVAVAVLAWAAAGGDGTLFADHGNGAGIEPGGGFLAEDEVDGALDVGLGIHLVPGLG